MNLYGAAVPATAHMGAWPGGTNVYQCSRSGGAWSTSSTIRMAIGLLIDQLDTGGGGVGSLVEGGLVQ